MSGKCQVWLLIDVALKLEGGWYEFELGLMDSVACIPIMNQVLTKAKAKEKDFNIFFSAIYQVFFMLFQTLMLVCS